MSLEFDIRPSHLNAARALARPIVAQAREGETNQHSRGAGAQKSKWSLNSLRPTRCCGGWDCGVDRDEMLMVNDILRGVEVEVWHV